MATDTILSQMRLSHYVTSLFPATSTFLYIGAAERSLRFTGRPDFVAGGGRGAQYCLNARWQEENEARRIILPSASRLKEIQKYKMEKLGSKKKKWKNMN